MYEIKITTRKAPGHQVVSRPNHISVIKKENSVRILANAKRGLPGAPGNDGRVYEVHAGNNIVVDNTDPANPIVSASPGLEGDLNYTADFTNQTSYTVNHNLGKYPAVTVIDSAGDEVIGGVEYLDQDTLRVVFSAPLSGRVTCN